MKTVISILRLVAILMLCTSSSAVAQLTWGTGGTGGTGTWDSATANWYSGSSNVPWFSGLTGTFAGTSGTVTVSGTQTASQLIFMNSTGTYTLNGGTVQGVSGTLSIVANRNAIINSTLGNFNTLAVSGLGMLTLSGSNTFTKLAVNSGTVFLASSTSTGAQPAGTGTITLGVAGTSSGTVVFANNNLSGINSFNGDIIANGNSGDTITLGGTDSLLMHGHVQVNGTGLTLTSTLALSFLNQYTGGAFSFYNTVSGTAGAILNINNSAVYMGGSNNNFQTVNITGTTIPSFPSVVSSLWIAAGNALPSNVAINLNNGAFSLSDGVTQTVASITGTNAAIIDNHTGSGMVTLVVNNSVDDTYSGILGNAAGSGNLALVKNGTGTLTLTRSNMYNGGTTINGGALMVTNTVGSQATGTGTVTVSSDATLGGSGKIYSSNITINGNVQAGMGGGDTTSILTMTTTGSAAFNNANLVFNLNAATPGQGNELVLGATPSVLFTTTTLTLNLQNSGIIPDGSQYTLLTSTGTGTGIGGSIFGGDLTYNSSTGVISGLNLTINGGGYNGSYLKLVADGGGYDIDVITVAAVPEPTTWALLLSVLAILGFFAPRRRPF